MSQRVGAVANPMVKPDEGSCDWGESDCQADLRVVAWRRTKSYLFHVLWQDWEPPKSHVSFLSLQTSRKHIKDMTDSATDTSTSELPVLVRIEQHWSIYHFCIVNPCSAGDRCHGTVPRRWACQANIVPFKMCQVRPLEKPRGRLVLKPSKAVGIVRSQNMVHRRGMKVFNMIRGLL